MILAENMHFVNVLPPVDANGAAKTGAIFSMKGASHATIVVQVGVSAGAVSTVTVNKCKNVAGLDAAAMPFAVYKEETDAGDTLGARVACTTTGFAMNTANNIFYVIEIDAAELGEDYSCIQLALTDPTASQITSALAILSGIRYKGDQNATAIA